MIKFKKIHINFCLVAPRAIPWGLLGMICLLGVVEGLLAQRELLLATAVTANSHFAAEMAQREGPACGVLAFGDSQVKCGVYPAVLEDRLDLRAFNLAVLASPPPACYFLLRRALDAGARPAAILVGYMTLSGNLDEHLPSLQELLGIRECFDLAWNAKDTSLFASAVLARCCPSVRGRHQIRNFLLGFLQRRGDDPKLSVEQYLQIWAANRGALRIPKVASFDGHMEAGLKETVYARRWQVNAVYARYFRRFLELAGAQEIPVYWLLSPITPEAQSLRDSLGLDAHHTRNVRAIQARYPDLCVIDARHAGYSHSAFADSCHLNSVGAEHLTSEIASIIRRGAQGTHAGERWLAVAQYRERPESGSVQKLANRPSGGSVTR
jgi:hypothetical protein